MGFTSEYRGVRFSAGLAASSARVYPWTLIPNPLWPPSVIRAEWTFALNDAEGVLLLTASNAPGGMEQFFS